MITTPKSHLLVKVVGFTALTSLLFFSCQTDSVDQRDYAIDEPIIGLASPIITSGDPITVNLLDYTLDLSMIDSLNCWNCVVDGSDFNDIDITLNEEAIVGRLNIYSSSSAFSVPVIKKGMPVYNFSWSPSGEYTSVALAGNFNDWNPSSTPLSFENGTWTTELTLAPGTYQYQIVADDNWMLDSGNPDSMDNNIGGFNSVLTIQSSNKLPVVAQIQSNKQGIEISLNKDVHAIALWQNQVLEFHGGNLSIPKAAEKLERSHIRIYTYNNQTYLEDYLIPLHNGIPMTSTDNLKRSDLHSNRLYFVMVDRFNNGNTANDDPIIDERVFPRANYRGGDLAGITQKFQDGYFSDLGINAIWISPITQNPLTAYQEWPQPRRFYSGYHGYWPISHSKIDHRFGTDEELHALVDAAHEKEANILLDFVANHVHEDHPIIKNNPGWKTQLVLDDGSMNIRIWDEQRLTTWFDTFLPSLDFENDSVSDVVSDSAMFWIQKFDLDGFRHDATKHIPSSFWRMLTYKLKRDVLSQEDEFLFQIGETFGSRELIASYISSGQLDAQFDFNLYFDARAVFALQSESFVRLESSLQQSLDAFGYHSLMGNISGNHDMPRFMAFASGALSFGEDPKAAGWERDIQVIDTTGYYRLAMLHAFNATIPGIPVIYYGDEIGMVGADDPDSRRMMRFSDLSFMEKGLLNTTQHLMNMRANHMSLNYGQIRTVHLDDDTYGFTRTYLDETALVLFNKGETSATINLEIAFEGKKQQFSGMPFEQVNDNCSITLQPHSFEIIIGKIK